MQHMQSWESTEMIKAGRQKDYSLGLQECEWSLTVLCWARMEKGAILGTRALGKVRAEQGIWISRMAYLRLLLAINKWEDFFIFYQTLAVICLSATSLYSVPYIYIYILNGNGKYIKKKLKHRNIYILKEKIK